MTAPTDPAPALDLEVSVAETVRRIVEETGKAQGLDLVARLVLGRNGDQP